MNLTVFTSGGKVYTNCECIKGYAFNLVSTRDHCALLPHKAAVSGLQGDHCAHFDAKRNLSLVNIL